MDNSFKEKYKNLIADLDKECEKYASMYSSQISCHKGCDSCCESISVFPVEFYFIRQSVDTAAIPPKIPILKKFSKKCRFLVDGACTIYNFRPVICRTQGLPLLYENREGKGYELSVCKLNFKGVEVTKFNMENALFMAPVNSRLFLLNREFVDQDSHKNLKEDTRLALNKI